MQKKIADPRISKRTYNTRSNQLSYTAILVSNATTRAELFGRSLVCLNEQGQLPTYSPIFYSLRIDARHAYQMDYRSWRVPTISFSTGLAHYFLLRWTPGTGNRSLLRLRLRKFLNPRDNQTSVGLYNHALVETIGIEPILGGPCFPLSSQRPIPI